MKQASSRPGFPLLFSYFTMRLILRFVLANLPKGNTHGPRCQSQINVNRQTLETERSGGCRDREPRCRGAPQGPGPDPAGADDREVVSFDGRVSILRWIDLEVAGRYGTMVLVRCGAEGTQQRTARAKKPAAAPPPQ
jgi:hypothetical protein